MSLVCSKILNHPYFENLSLLLVFINTFILTFFDDSNLDYVDDALLGLFTFEMMIKMFAFGFFKKNGYFRDNWNLIDFFIVASGLVQLFFQGGSFKLSGLRSFRILRILRNITSIHGLKEITNTILISLPLLFDIFLILAFFLFIMSIAALHTFSGFFKNRCFNEGTGLAFTDFVCGAANCDVGFVCGKMLKNPENDNLNFDGIFSSALLVFQIITLEGWTEIAEYARSSVNEFVLVFFIFTITFGNYFLLNITLVVIKQKFSESNSYHLKIIENVNQEFIFPYKKFITLVYLNELKKKKKKNDINFDDLTMDSNMDYQVPMFGIGQLKNLEFNNFEEPLKRICEKRRFLKFKLKNLIFLQLNTQLNQKPSPLRKMEILKAFKEKIELDKSYSNIQNAGENKNQEKEKLLMIYKQNMLVPKTSMFGSKKNFQIFKEIKKRLRSCLEKSKQIFVKISISFEKLIGHIFKKLFPMKFTPHIIRAEKHIKINENIFFEITELNELVEEEIHKVLSQIPSTSYEKIIKSPGNDEIFSSIEDVINLKYFYKFLLY